MKLGYSTRCGVRVLLCAVSLLGVRQVAAESFQEWLKRDKEAMEEFKRQEARQTQKNPPSQAKDRVVKKPLRGGTGVVTDETQTVSAESAARVESAIGKLESSRGAKTAVMFSGAADLEALKAAANIRRAELVKNGVLPEASAVFACAGERFCYSRSAASNAVIPEVEVEKAWASTAGAGSQADRMVGMLSKLVTAFAPVGTSGSAEIGPEGGRMELTGEVKIVIPEGSLDRKCVVSVTKVAGSGNGNIYDIQVRESVKGRAGGEAKLLKPVRLSFLLPASGAASDYVPMTEVSDGVFIQVAVVEVGDGILTVEAAHFSKWGVVGKVFLIVAVGASIGAVGFGTGVSLGYWLLAGETITVTGEAVLICAVGAGIGAIAAGPAYIAYNKLTKGQLPNIYCQDGIRIYYCCPTDGTQSPDAITETAGKSYWVDSKGIVVRDDAPGAVKMTIPDVVERTMALLRQSRQYYIANGYAVPAEMDVLIHGRLSTAGSAANVGEWDHKFLQLNAGFVTSKEVNRGMNLPPTIAHEMFHAICDQTVGKDPFPGFEDCFCTTFESEVFPWATESFEDYSMDKGAVVWANGLTQPGSDEADCDSDTRGYRFWPWGKYVLHSQGHEYVRKYAKMEITPADLMPIFKDFGRAILVRELALDDPAKMPDPTDSSVEVNIPTGWKDLKKARRGMIEAMPANTLKLGKTERGQANPWSFSLLVVDVPAMPAVPTDGTAPGLVIRRVNPGVNEEFMAINHGDYATITTGDWSLDDLEIGRGGVYVQPAWLKPSTGVKLPVALVGNRNTPQGSGELCIYKLGPPTSITFKPAKGSGIEVSWKAPEVPAGLELTDCFASYRLYGRKDESSQPVPIIADGGEVVVPADKTSVAIPSTAFTESGLTWLGIASEDKALKVRDKPLMSPIAWIRQDIQVYPVTVDLTFQEELKFRVTAGFMGDDPPTTWKTDGGAVVSGTTFKAGGKEGKFTLTVQIEKKNKAPATASVRVNIYRPVSDAELAAAAKGFVEGPKTPVPSGVRILSIRQTGIDRKMIYDPFIPSLVPNKQCAWGGYVGFERKGELTRQESDGTTHTEEWKDFPTIWTRLTEPGGNIVADLVVPASSLDDAF